MTEIRPTNHLIDTHCHLDFEEFDHDRALVIDRAKKLGVQQLIIPAVKYATWQDTINVCKEHQDCYLTLGLHPVFIDEHQPQHLNELDDAISRNQVVAVGEIGLDFYSKNTNHEKQRMFFTKQLIIAKHHGLPVVIHNRKAHDECIKLLSEFKVKGIIHAFNGSIQQAYKYIELGCVLGFGGMLTFTRSSKLHSLVEKLPLSAIVLETDAPDMTVSQHAGERNSPEYIPLILEEVAKLKGETIETITLATTENVNRILNPNHQP